MAKLARFLVGVAMAGCARMAAVGSVAEADAAVGKVVRVSGTAQREKLGDSIAFGELRVVCLAPRFPDERIGKAVTVEGKLDRSDRFNATVDERGAISQGTAPGTFTYSIAACALR